MAGGDRDAYPSLRIPIRLLMAGLLLMGLGATLAADVSSPYTAGGELGLFPFALGFILFAPAAWVVAFRLWLRSSRPGR
ncbi:MAG TPA: hypothetical protein VJQ43_01845 [Thermoplasmata archaeon]|nr:hypothetical protein [Thermoplasmata archaeon]